MRQLLQIFHYSGHTWIEDHTFSGVVNIVLSIFSYILFRAGKRLVLAVLHCFVTIYTLVGYWLRFVGFVLARIVYLGHLLPVLSSLLDLGHLQEGIQGHSS